MEPVKKYQSERHRQVVEMIMADKKVSEIVKETGYTHSNILKIGRQYGCRRKTKKEIKVMSDKKIMELHGQGKTNIEIADAMGMSERHIHNVIYEHERVTKVEVPEVDTSRLKKAEKKATVRVEIVNGKKMYDITDLIAGR